MLLLCEILFFKQGHIFILSFCNFNSRTAVNHAETGSLLSCKLKCMFVSCVMLFLPFIKRRKNAYVSSYGIQRFLLTLFVYFQTADGTNENKWKSRTMKRNILNKTHKNCVSFRMYLIKRITDCVTMAKNIFKCILASVTFSQMKDNSCKLNVS